jgi:DNA invertase Pin-like site-specific DNA recombinase
MLNQAMDTRNEDSRAIAIYARKSNKTEGRSKSVEEQIEFCRSVIAALSLEGREVRLYADPEGVKGEWWWEDSHGRNPKPWRKELTRLVHDIESGEVGAVVVWRSDRLYRDAGVCDGLARLFINRRVRVIMQGREVDPGSADGRFQVTVEAANNRRWRDQISEDVRRDHDLKARLGMFTRNPSCLGFRSKGKDSQAVLPVEEELEIVRRIFRLYVHGEDGSAPMSPTGIAKKLMREGVRVAVGAKGHKAKDASLVHESQIRTILSNPMYVGRWRHLEQECECAALRVCGDAGSNGAAISTELFEAARAKLRSTKTRSEKAKYSAHLLTGLAVCGGCGRPMQLGSKRLPDGTTARVFKCVNKTGDRCPRGASVGVRDHVLDEWVLGALLPFIRREISEAAISIEAQELEEQRLVLEARVRDIRRKETEELKSLVGALDAVQVAAIAADFRMERCEAEAHLERLRDRIDAQARAIEVPDEDLLGAKDKSRMKQALMSFLNWIALTKGGVVAYTKSGAIIAASYDGSTLTGYKRQGAFRRVEAPSARAAVGCAEWFPCPKRFVEGRRYVLGAVTAGLSDSDILPFVIWPRGDEEGADA